MNYQLSLSLYTISKGKINGLQIGGPVEEVSRGPK